MSIKRLGNKENFVGHLFAGDGKLNASNINNASDFTAFDRDFLDLLKDPDFTACL